MSNLDTALAFAKTRWGNNFSSSEDLRQYQYRKLQDHINFLRDKSAYFNAFSTITSLDDIKKWPIMDKEIMMDNFDKINTLGLKKNDALNLAIKSEKSKKYNKKIDGVSVGLSSGTSGHRGLFIVSDKEREQWAGSILAKCLPPNQIFSQRVALFLRANNNLYETIGNWLMSFRYFDIYDSISINLRKVQEFNPTILVAPPSVLLIIAEAIESGTITLKPNRVISVAEVLELQDEVRLKTIFGQKIIHQIYQCTEGFLACTCKFGSIHLNEDIVYFEKEYVGQNRFIPIITDFRRTSQPIIRYRLNDILVESKSRCKCGSVMTKIARIEGRESDILLFRDFENQLVKVFPDTISRCMIYASGFNEFRVVQTDYGSLDIFLDVISVQTKRSVNNEIALLSSRLKFKPPVICFKPYQYNRNVKLRRIERKFNG